MRNARIVVGSSVLAVALLMGANLGHAQQMQHQPGMKGPGMGQYMMGPGMPTGGMMSCPIMGRSMMGPGMMMGQGMGPGMTMGHGPAVEGRLA